MSFYAHLTNAVAFTLQGKLYQWYLEQCAAEYDLWSEGIFFPSCEKRTWLRFVWLVRMRPPCWLHNKLFRFRLPETPRQRPTARISNQTRFYMNFSECAFLSQHRMSHNCECVVKRKFMAWFFVYKLQKILFRNGPSYTLLWFLPWFKESCSPEVSLFTRLFSCLCDSTQALGSVLQERFHQQCVSPKSQFVLHMYCIVWFVPFIFTWNYL